MLKKNSKGCPARPGWCSEGEAGEAGFFFKKEYNSGGGVTSKGPSPREITPSSLNSRRKAVDAFFRGNDDN